MIRHRTKVSDHAVVRYLEWVWGVNIDGVRQRLGKRADVATKAGASAVVIDGLRYSIQNGRLVTVHKKHRCKVKRRRAKSAK